MKIKLLFVLHVGLNLILQGVPFVLFPEKGRYPTCGGTPRDSYRVQDNNTKQTKYF
jgi:hypothetical protein